MHLELPSAPHPIVAHAKFFSRSGCKFFFKGMRLRDVGGTLDLYEKLKLRGRLEELKAAHTTGLILTETQAQPVLDLVAAAGMVAIIELKVTAAELLDTARFGTAISRIAHTANIYRSHKGLCGYLIDSPSSNSKTIRNCLGVLLRTLKEHDEGSLVAVEHREDSGLAGFAEEDFLYGVIGFRSTSQVPEFVASLHEQAGTRPVVVEFPEARPDQHTSLAIAFGAGAAGVVAAQVPSSASRDRRGLRMLRSRQAMPFVALNGSCPPPPAKPPLVSVVVRARDAKHPIARCLESLSQLAYPNYEVVVHDGAHPPDAESQYSEVPVIRSPHEARGEIIAFVGSNYVADPDWLTFIVRKMQESNLEGCGGLISAEHSTGLVAASVAVAEEVTSPGCFENVAVSRQALTRMGGLEAVATCDDISSRMRNAGVRVGHSPAALMWKLRPHTLHGFLARQGSGGGPEGARLATKRRPYVIASATRSLGWMLFWIVVALASRLVEINVVPALAMLLVGPILAIWNFWDAPLERTHRGSAARVLVGVLAYVGSLWRDIMHCRTFLRRQFGSRGAIPKSERFHHRVALR